jgi:hypothetical protein
VTDVELPRYDPTLKWTAAQARAYWEHNYACVGEGICSDCAGVLSAREHAFPFRGGSVKATVLDCPRCGIQWQPVRLGGESGILLQLRPDSPVRV